MLSVLWFTDSDCQFGIFKLFLQIKMIRGEARVAMVPMGDRKRFAISTNQIASWFVCGDVTNYSSNDDFHVNWQIDQHDEWRIFFFFFFFRYTAIHPLDDHQLLNIRVWLGMGYLRYVLLVKKCSNLKTNFTTTNKNQTNNEHNIYYKRYKIKYWY
jgi:hypothetical protein